MFSDLFKKKEVYTVRVYVELKEIPYERHLLGRKFVFTDENEARKKARDLYDKSKCLLGEFIPVYSGGEYVGAGTVNYVYIPIYSDRRSFLDSLHIYEKSS